MGVPYYQIKNPMSSIKWPIAINISMNGADDFDFFVSLYLDYFRNVDEMALDKKKRFLRNLFKRFSK
jgi:hypothetical protein